MPDDPAKPPSRQRAYQARQLAAVNRVRCGRPREVSARTQCERCRTAAEAVRRAKGLRASVPGGPGRPPAAG